MRCIGRIAAAGAAAVMSMAVATGAASAASGPTATVTKPGTQSFSSEKVEVASYTWASVSGKVTWGAAGNYTVAGTVTYRCGNPLTETVITVSLETRTGNHGWKEVSTVKCKLAKAASQDISSSGVLPPGQTLQVRPVFQRFDDSLEPSPKTSDPVYGKTVRVPMVLDPSVRTKAYSASLPWSSPGSKLAFRGTVAWDAAGNYQAAGTATAKCANFREVHIVLLHGGKGGKWQHSAATGCSVNTTATHILVVSGKLGPAGTLQLRLSGTAATQIPYAADGGVKTKPGTESANSAITEFKLS